jgi:hypothetical protein
VTIRNVSYSTMEHAFAGEDIIVEQARRVMKGIDYDTMIGTGLSGSLVIPTLARALGKKWAIIRKPGDGSHGNPVGFEGEIGRRWIFVDDFVASGATRQRVRDAVDRIVRVEGPLQLSEDELGPIYVGDYLYCDSGHFTLRLPPPCECYACQRTGQ